MGLKHTVLKNNFTSGQVAPLFYGAVNTETYQAACKRMVNAVPIPQGGFVRRGGTKYVGSVENSTKVSRLIEFTFSSGEELVIELADQKIRFIKDGEIIQSGGSAVVVTSPYTEAQLFDVDYVQSLDVVYLVHKDHAPRKLSRISDTSWTLSTITFTDGPYAPINTTSTTITPSAATGTGVTLTASANTFKASDVGRLFRLFIGTEWGWGTIASYVSATEVTIDIESDLGGTTASSIWRFGLYGSDEGYPITVNFAEDRLWLAGSPAYPQTQVASKTGSYEDFTPTETDAEVRADNGLSFTLNSPQYNEIRWIIGTEFGVLSGTAGAEWIVRASENGPITPTNAQARQLSTIGSENISAILAKKGVVFIQNGGEHVYDMLFSSNLDGYTPRDISLTFDNILSSRVKQIAYQSKPYSLLWGVLDDGGLVSCLYSPEMGLAGWSKHELGGTDVEVESVAALSDTIYMTVKRTVNGSTVRYIEYLSDFKQDTGNQEDLVFVDSSITYSGASSSTLSGLSHLEGESVTVLVDGATESDLTVSSGSVSLVNEGTKITGGLKYGTLVETLPTSGGTPGGIAEGKIRRIDRVTYYVVNSGEFSVGYDENNLDFISMRSTDTPFGTPQPPATGQFPISFNGGYGKEETVVTYTERPLPLTVLYIIMNLEQQDR